MSNIALTFPSGTVNIPVSSRSRAVLFSPTVTIPLSGGAQTAATSSVQQGVLYGTGAYASSGSGDWGTVLRQLDERAGSDSRFEYSSVAPATNDNAGVNSVPQITNLGISVGNLTVTRTGGSDVVPVATSFLWVKRAPTDGTNAAPHADRFIGLAGATAASWTP